MSKIIRKVDFNEVIIFVLTVIIILGNFIKVDSFRVFGMVLTLYRVGILLFTFGFIAKRFLNRKIAKVGNFSNLFIIFSGIMMFWVLYGAVSMFISPYSNIKDAVKELFSLTLGLCSVFCIYECCGDRKSIEFFIKCLKLICVALMLVALFESITNLHLYTSQLYVYIDYAKYGISRFIGFGLPEIFASTSIFFGINDFCTLLGVMLPLFFYNPQESRKINIFNIFVLALGVLILSINDANIVLLSLMFALVVYTVLVREALKQNLVTVAGTLFIHFFGYQWFNILLIKIKSSIMPIKKSDILLYYKSLNGTIPSSSSHGSIKDVITSQLENAEGGTGSLHSRLIMYMESLQLTLETRGLGIGPAGFMPYFIKNEHKSDIVNPHNWWLEILSQYGIFVFIAYVGFILYEYVAMIKRYLKNHQILFAIVVAMCTSFVIASIAPSSFLGYSYQWILPALCIVMIKTDDNSEWKTRQINHKKNR